MKMPRNREKLKFFDMSRNTTILGSQLDFKRRETFVKKFHVPLWGENWIFLIIKTLQFVQFCFQIFMLGVVLGRNWIAYQNLKMFQIEKLQQKMNQACCHLIMIFLPAFYKTIFHMTWLTRMLFFAIRPKRNRCRMNFMCGATCHAILVLSLPLLLFY